MSRWNTSKSNSHCLSRTRRDTPTSAPPPSAGAARGVAGSQGNMPAKMKDYVNRAFLGAGTEAQRDKVHKHLDAKLNRIFAEARQWSIDWDNEPLPL